jgi:membrane-associated protease RseP (regulator of RpoE activity)
MSEPNSPIASSTIEFYQPLPPPEIERPSERYWLHGLLLLATIFTTLVVGSRMEANFLQNLSPFTVGNERIPFFPIGWVLAHPSRLLLGIPFSFTLLLILLAHEMGHYLYCRYYGVRATLPFFIPAPTLIGTLGAVIRIKAPIRSRAALFDIGIAGPIAGFVVALFTLAAALTLSKPLSHSVPPPDLILGFPEIFYLMHRLLHLIDPEYVIASVPLSRISLHPTAIAAWVGMYATALNLLPSGQLDGGHIVYALAPRAHRVISWITVLALIVLGRYNYGWWFWGGLITVMNIFTFRQRQAPKRPLLPGNRWIFGAIALLMLALTFTVVPFRAN